MLFHTLLLHKLCVHLIGSLTLLLLLFFIISIKTDAFSDCNNGYLGYNLFTGLVRLKSDKN